MLFILEPGDGTAVDLVRPVGEAQRAYPSIGARKPGILRHAGAAERLDGVVNDLP